MNTDFRVSVDFFAHHKARKLRKRLGPAALLSLLQLWAYAAKVRTDGSLFGMTIEDIELAAEWDGEDEAFCSALLEIGFLDQGDDGFSLHDWEENNQWVAGEKARREQARKNAKTGWEKRKGGNQQPTNDADKMQPLCDGNAPAMQPHQFRNAPSPKPKPKPEEKDKDPTPELSTWTKGDARAHLGAEGVGLDEESPPPPNDEPGIEFVELRELYSRLGRDEGPLDGFAEYKQAKKAKSWPGLSRISQSVAEFHEKDGEWQRGFAPGLAKYLREKRWLRTPKPPQPQPARDGPQVMPKTYAQAQDAEMRERAARVLQNMREEKQNGGLRNDSPGIEQGKRNPATPCPRLPA